MSFKLTKEERELHGALITSLTKATETLKQAAAVPGEYLGDAITSYNQVIAECEEFRQNVAERLGEDFDSKSEKWQESDAGGEAYEFINAWEELTLDELAEDDQLDNADALSEIEATLETFTNIDTEAAA